jgi:hypothetical protein
MEQNREPRNKSIYFQPIDFNTGSKNIHWGERAAASINDVGKTGYSRAENETGFLSLTSYKN